MLELELPVTNPFADDSAASNHHDTLVTLTLDSLSHHPLRTRSASPARSSSIPSVTVVDSEGEMRPRLTPLLSLEEEEEAASEVPQDGSDIIIHSVRSFPHPSSVV